MIGYKGIVCAATHAYQSRVGSLQEVSPVTQLCKNNTVSVVHEMRDIVTSKGKTHILYRGIEKTHMCLRRCPKGAHGGSSSPSDFG